MDSLFAVGLATLAATIEHAGLALLIGVLMAPWWIRSDSLGTSAKRLRGAAWIGWASSAVGALLRLWFAASAMADAPLWRSGPAIASVLASTHYGRAWFAGWIALVLMAFALARPRRSASLMLSLGCVACIWSLAAVSHASADGDFTALTLLDGLHVVFIDAWVGSVWTAAWMTTSTTASADPIERSAGALSTLATLALAGAVSTGVMKAWIGFGSPAALPGSAAGVVLIVKLLFVAVAVALGAFNRFAGLPRLPASTRRVATVLRVESVVLLAVVVAAALLGSLPPP